MASDKSPTQTSVVENGNLLGFSCLWEEAVVHLSLDILEPGTPALHHLPFSPSLFSCTSDKKNAYKNVERASLMAQLVKNLLAMQETWIKSLGWEDPLEKEMATRAGILANRIL